MSTHPQREEEAVLEELSLTGASLWKAEQDWKALRALSKKLSLELITEHGVSVAKVSRLSGHTRATIKIWLDVWNAEHRNPHRKN